MKMILFRWWRTYLKKIILEIAFGSISLFKSLNLCKCDVQFRLWSHIPKCHHMATKMHLFLANSAGGCPAAFAISGIFTRRMVAAEILIKVWILRLLLIDFSLKVDSSHLDTFRGQFSDSWWQLWLDDMWMSRNGGHPYQVPSAGGI